jgi:tripartite-type tricarboxylate transporter receptor subunit TctC
MHEVMSARVRPAAPVGRCLQWCWSIRLRRRSCFDLLFGLAVLLLAAQARGEAPHSDFPNRPIRIIVAVPAGGGVDLSTRIAAEALHQARGQPVTVENRTGGGNNIAGEMVANAEPDGYTLLATPPNIVTANAALYKQLNYDPAALEPVAIMAVGPNVLAVKNASPAHTVADLITLAKANPGTMSYASQGNGSTTHLTMELFLSRTGVKLVHVPCRGAAPAANDLAGGHVDTMFCDLGTVLPLHQGGRVRIIATATLERLSQIPEVPTIDESSVKGFSSTTFYALMAPPKTPLEVREKLNKAIVAAMGAPEAEAKLKTIFVRASPLDVHETGDFIKAQAKLWGDVIRAAHITIDP